MLAENLYTTCRELTLDRFIDCIIHGKIERLIKHGTATHDELNAAWSQIYNEYLELVNTPGHSYVMGLLNTVGGLYTRITVGEWCIKALSYQRAQSCIDRLKELGISLDFPEDNPGRYAEDLKAAAKFVKKWVVEYQMKQKEYEDYDIKQENRPITEGDFMDGLTELSRYMGYRLNPAEITVYEYAAILRNVNRKALTDG